MSVILLQSRKDCWQSWSIHNNEIEANEEAIKLASNKDSEIVISEDDVLLMAKSIKQHKQLRSWDYLKGR